MAKTMQRVTKNELRSMVRGAYDIQKLRIAMGNRIVQNWKVRNGQKPSQPEEGMDKEALKILKKIRVSYRKITDGLLDNGKQLLNTEFKGDEYISQWAEFVLVQRYEQMHKTENEAFASIEPIMGNFPIWNDYLFHVKGCGPAMSAVLISEINIYTSKYPSSLWKYAGLDCADLPLFTDEGRPIIDRATGKQKITLMAGRSRKKGHLVKVKYLDKKGKEAERDSITFNPFLKTKMMGVLADCLMRARGPYKEIYDGYKHRLQQAEKHQEKSDGHRNWMSKRYMIKRFLADLYIAWRKIDGLEVYPEYSEAKLGLRHGQQ